MDKKKISAKDFVKMLDYYFTVDFQLNQYLVLKNEVKIGPSQIKNSTIKSEITTFYINTTTLGRPIKITLNNIMSSTIEGVPFYKYKLIQKIEKPFICDNVELRHDIERLFINKVTALKNLITGEEKVYPLRFYNDFEKIYKKTNQFEYVSNEDLVNLFNSGLKERVNVNSYYKYVDFIKFEGTSGFSLLYNFKATEKTITISSAYR